MGSGGVEWRSRNGSQVASPVLTTLTPPPPKSLNDIVFRERPGNGPSSPHFPG